MISKEEFKKFKKIYKKRFGRNISDQDALESATKLFKKWGQLYFAKKKKN